MKKDLFILSIALLFVQLVACERSLIPDDSELRASSDTLENQSSPRHIATKTTTDIKLRDNHVFELINGTSTKVMWKVAPAATILHIGTKAVIQFRKPGLHRVYAIDSVSADTTFLDVTVATEMASDPKYYEQDFYDNDEVLITPHTFPDSANILELRAITTRSYECLNNLLIIYQEKQGNTYRITFDKVASGNVCMEGAKKAENSSWISNSSTGSREGNIEITFKNKLYKGSFRRNGASYEFDWDHQEGVIFTTKKI
ncbi:hypothetical protein [Dyadobacter crusticola]|uniref:hypothetical protein n=1 Tax=Dyadobacter crusticola TaxID=292407 RepID=UPI0012F99F38|nr:hypothetical protein [Dyadobacter crusticola]